MSAGRLYARTCQEQGMEHHISLAAAEDRRNPPDAQEIGTGTITTANHITPLGDIGVIGRVRYYERRFRNT